MTKSLILDLHNDLINGKKTIKDIVDNVKKIHDKISITNSIITSTINSVDINKLQTELKNNEDNLLYAIPYSLKDNVSTKDILSTGGSLFLSNYVPPFSATIYNLLLNKQALLTSKASLDEFGLGGTGTYCYTGDVLNYYDNTRITGGSSSGSVNLVASGADLFSIGTDTGDSIRHPSSFLGTVGYKPTYGIISRYGIFPYSPSLDHVGIIANYVADCAIAADTLVQYDENDYTSQKIEKNFYKNLKEEKALTFNVIKDIEKYLDDSVLDLYKNAIEQIKQQGHKINEVPVKWEVIKAIAPTYQIITYAEANSCYANMTGIPFGKNFDENITGYTNIITNNRTKGFGSQVKRRFTIGAYITQNKNYEGIFKKARKLRALMIQENEMLLSNCDAYIIPSASSIAPKIDDVKNKKYSSNLADDLLQLANFGSSPSITIPVGFSKIEKMPFGININTKRFEDQKMFNIALTLENIFKFNKENR